MIAAEHPLITRIEDVRERKVVKQFTRKSEKRSSSDDGAKAQELSSMSRGQMCLLIVLVLIVVYFAISTFFSTNSHLTTEITLLNITSLAGLLFAASLLIQVLKRPTGTEEMNEVADAIFEGSVSFYSVQCSWILTGAVVVSILLFLGYSRTLEYGKLNPLEPMYKGILFAFVFMLGAISSTFAGGAGLWVCTHANIRVASAARSSFRETMEVAIYSGAIPAILIVALVIVGISGLLLFIEISVLQEDENNPRLYRVPMLLVGYGFGASFVAMFAQLGGGIFTKAADVGADLVGKVEEDLDEDDPRNPAVVADLVGDNVGDCAGRGADLFESIAAEIIAAMILGAMLAESSTGNQFGFIVFPLVTHAISIVVSIVGMYFSIYIIPFQKPASGWKPMQYMRYGYYCAQMLAIPCFYAACYYCLGDHTWHFFLCGIVGMTGCLLTLWITEYYTDYTYRPVIAIGESSEMGHATNIIQGMSMGMESTGLPVVVISCCILSSFFFGKATGLESGGLYGTAVATMGFLSTAVYVLTMDFFGPISDNAGGIVEMAGEPEHVREITDLLDAAGNTTKAATKGYAVVSATLAAFLLLRAFMDEITQITQSQTEFNAINLNKPEVFVAGLLGACLVFVFTSMTLRAVGETAGEVVREVRRQFNEIPGLREGTQKPDYKTCVAIVTTASLKKMIAPGFLVLITPVFVGVLFNYIGAYTGDKLLGAECVCSFLLFATSTGVLTALFLNNAGGAWDNAKKLVETGAYGGKNSEAHKAAVTGDTVGDPFKDTSGPSIHVLMKLISTITLCMAPLFVGA